MTAGVVSVALGGVLRPGALGAAGNGLGELEAAVAGGILGLGGAGTTAEGGIDPTLGELVTGFGSGGVTGNFDSLTSIGRLGIEGGGDPVDGTVGSIELAPGVLVAGGIALGLKLGMSMFGGGRSNPPAGRTPSEPAITGLVRRGFVAPACCTPVGVYPGGGGM